MFSTVARLVAAAAVVAALPADAPKGRTGTPADIVLSNAQRLQHGQRPKAPTPARRDVPSAVPSQGGGGGTIPGVGTQCGRIIVNDANVDTFLGYVDSSVDANGIYTLTNSTDAAVQVFYNEHLLQITSGAPQFPYLGASAFSFNEPPVALLADGSLNVAVFATAPETPYGQPPVNTTNSYTVASSIGNYPTESAIFYLDLATGELTASWVNPNGTFYDGDFVYDNSEDELAIGNIDAFVAAGIDFVEPVRLFCESILPV